jgi:hypothetical protein
MSKTKISLLIFSKDRASQLCLLLDSIERNAPNEFDIRVILKSSSPEFTAGYEKLGDYYPDLSISLEVDPDVSFKELTLDAMNKMGGNELFCMMTDDCLMFRPVPIQEIKDAFRVFPDEVGVASIRLGENTDIETYFTNSKMQPLNYVIVDNNLIGWQHKHYSPNSAYGYQFSIDGNVWRTEELLPIIRDADFNSPNTLEANLSGKTHLLKDYVVAPKLQTLCACPVNSVAGWNRSGDYFAQSTKFLNEQFIRGKNIDLDEAIRYSVEHVKATHWEIPYQFCERSER